MDVRNIYEIEKKPVPRCHEGEGTIFYCQPFSKADFQTKWTFVDHSILPPGSSIGLHKHGANEEMYFILEGEGVMTVDGEQRRVKKGDMILNKPGGTHGLRNDSNSDLVILVMEVEL